MRRVTAEEVGRRLEELKPWYRCVPVIGFYATAEVRRTWAVEVRLRDDGVYLGTLDTPAELADWEL